MKCSERAEIEEIAAELYCSAGSGDKAGCPVEAAGFNVVETDSFKAELNFDVDNAREHVRETLFKDEPRSETP